MPACPLPANQTRTRSPMSQMLLNSPEFSPSTNATALRRIIEEKMKDLPTLPIVVAKILQTAASPSATAHDLQALIAVDAGLTAKILRLANSTFYGQSRRITTLADAVMVLGFNTVRNLTLSASMLDSLAPRGAAQVFDWRAFWEHCTGVAACARLLAQRQRLPKAVADEAFVAGLLHDIGKLFLGKYCPDLLVEVVLTSETFQVPMEEAEWRLMGTSHALLGQEIAEQWNFPPTLAGAIGAHHSPEGWHGDPTLTYIVHAANVLTQEAGIGAVDPAPQLLHRDVDAWLPMTTVEREDLYAELACEMEKTQALLEWDDEEAVPTPRASSAPSLGARRGEKNAANAGPGEEKTSDLSDEQKIVHIQALKIAGANTIADVQALLIEGAHALLPIWGSAVFLWDDAVSRFVPNPVQGPDPDAPASQPSEAWALLSKIGEQQIRESLLDIALSSKSFSHQVHNARFAVVAPPQALLNLTEGHRFLACALAGSQKTIGFLLLGQHTQTEPASGEQSEALATLAAHAAAAIARVQSFRSSVVALSTALDARDPHSNGHSQRVHDLALGCARQLGLSLARIETLAVAALLHDVGKLSLPDRILNKPSQLNAQEFYSVATHAASGAHLAGHTFGEVMPFILCHHERWDGLGYPAGLRGAQIPVEAQIIAVCEAWDAMRTGHSYRSALPLEAAQAELRKNRDTQFSPLVVDAFLTVLPRV